MFFRNRAFENNIELEQFKSRFVDEYAKAMACQHFFSKQAAFIKYKTDIMQQITLFESDFYKLLLLDFAKYRNDLSHYSVHVKTVIELRQISIEQNHYYNRRSSMQNDYLPEGWSHETETQSGTSSHSEREGNERMNCCNMF